MSKIKHLWSTGSKFSAAGSFSFIVFRLRVSKFEKGISDMQRRFKDIILWVFARVKIKTSRNRLESLKDHRFDVSPWELKKITGLMFQGSKIMKIRRNHGFQARNEGVQRYHTARLRKREDQDIRESPWELQRSQVRCFQDRRSSALTHPITEEASIRVNGNGDIATRTPSIT